MAEIKDIVTEGTASELSRSKAEVLISQVFNYWNNIKRCKTLSDNSNYEPDRIKYELEV